MNIIKTELLGLLILEPMIFEDERGYFFESFNEKKFTEAGLKDFHFIQDNESKSGKGVLRGLHYQLEPYAQTKLVRVLFGKVFDVAVDIRKNSPTFGKWHGVELTGENKKQFLIPHGFAHGFSVLSEYAVFIYKCDNFYNPSAERGINYADPQLSIEWKIDLQTAIISPRDKSLPLLKDAEMNFSF
ncbi:MAG: dTDP-4-dehydrorhamnose 3,5-epimerase [Bacteroidia bacterium]|nr:dTDP-4-dehydrorhamnose 3,5-epimerase [Bacteroidia bacterium]